MSLNRGATHFTLGLRPCIILPITNTPAPPLKFTPLRPCLADRSFVVECMLKKLNKVGWTILFSRLLVQNGATLEMLKNSRSNL